MSSSPGPAPARGPLAAGRVGLSEYTAQRLAELRARRADADSADSQASKYSGKPALAPRPPVNALNRTDDVVPSTTSVNGLLTETTTDVMVAQSSSVSPPRNYHHQQQQQQQHHFTASRHSPSVNRHCETTHTVNTTTAHHQVHTHTHMARLVLFCIRTAQSMPFVLLTDRKSTI